MPLLGQSSNTVLVSVDSKSSNKGIDDTTSALGKLSGQQDKTKRSTDAVDQSVQNTNKNLVSLAAVTAGAGLATGKMTSFMMDSIDAANKLQSSLLGLNSVATAFGADADKAKAAAQDLAKDGLMTVADSATGLKNLLAAGFNLKEATTLMDRFKDSAAFGRQGSLSFGEAIRGATEGVKNGNSILVDNAGVTKNLSLMLEDAGYSAQDLMKASTDAGVRQAIFNGILKETNAQLGDAEKLTNTTAGKQAMMAAQTEILKQKIGESLQPALLALLNVVTPIVTTVADWIGKNPQLAAGILIVGTGLLGLITVINATATAIPLISTAFAVMSSASIASIGGVQTAFMVMKGLVMSPMVMPAIAVAAALAALALVYDAAMKARSAVEGAQAMIDQNNKSGADLRALADRQYASGKIDKKERDRLYGVANLGKDTKISAFDKFMTGMATGGRVQAGQPYVVGDNPDGSINRNTEMFVPSSSGRIFNAQDTQKMIGGGGGSSYHIANVNLMSADAVREFFNISDMDAQNRVNRLSPSRGGA